MALWGTIPNNTVANTGQTVRRKLDDSGWEGWLLPTTKSDIGLGNVDDTSDANKPMSTATQNAMNLKEDIIAAGTNTQYYRGDKTWQTLDKSSVGLSNVDNTSDASKPISTLTQTALNGKQSTITTGTTAQYLRGDLSLATFPSIPAAQVNSDWNAVSGVAQILNKPSLPAADSQSSATRSLNTAYQVSTTRNALVVYSVSIANVLTLTGGAAGLVVLEIATNAGFTTGVQEIGRVGNSNTGGLVVGLTLNDAVSVQVMGFVPINYYVRLRTSNTTGTPAYNYLSGQEILM